MAQRLEAIPELSRARAELASALGEDEKYRELTSAQWRAKAAEGFAGIGLLREAEALGCLPAEKPAAAHTESAKPRPVSGNGK
jgi:hypothetical protein